MFKQFKSMFLLAWLYRFRKKLTAIIVLFVAAFLLDWLFSDLVDFLKSTQQTKYLNYLFLSKWVLILLSIGFAFYLIFTIFKVEFKTEKKNKTQLPTQKKTRQTTAKKATKAKLTEREKSFLTKKPRSKAEILLDR
jgi:predicted membrane protein